VTPNLLLTCGRTTDPQAFNVVGRPSGCEATPGILSKYFKPATPLKQRNYFVTKMGPAPSAAFPGMDSTYLRHVCGHWAHFDSDRTPKFTLNCPRFYYRSPSSGKGWRFSSSPSPHSAPLRQDACPPERQRHLRAHPPVVIHHRRRNPLISVPPALVFLLPNSDVPGIINPLLEPAMAERSRSHTRRTRRYAKVGGIVSKRGVNR